MLHDPSEDLFTALFCDLFGGWGVAGNFISASVNSSLPEFGGLLAWSEAEHTFTDILGFFVVTFVDSFFESNTGNLEAAGTIDVSLELIVVLWLRDVVAIIVFAQEVVQIQVAHGAANVSRKDFV